MVSLLRTILTPQGFEAHGYCFLWTRPLLWLYIVSDSLIALSYYSIPIALVYFVRKRRDLAFHWAFLMFAAFILACGTTHVMALWTLWMPVYWLDGAVKALTAIASVATAAALWPLIPKALAIPSPAQLQATNLMLQGEVIERQRAEAALRRAHDELEIRVQERTEELVRANVALEAQITERKRAEERLRLQSAALEAAANAVVITNREGRIVWVNPAFSSLTGYASEETLGQTPRLLKSGKHDQSFYENLWGTILSGQVWRGKVVNRRKDGSLFTEEQTVTPVRDSQGQISHFVAIKQDVTERERAQDTQARLVAILEATTDYVGIADADGRTLYLNAGGRRMRGIGEAEDVSGAPVEDRHPEWALALLRDEAIPTAIRDGVWRGETAFRTREGREIPVSQVILAHKGPDGTVRFLSTIARDLTDWKRAEEQLRQAQMLEAVGLLAGGVAHDFNNLLNGIMGFADLALRELPPGSKAHGYLCRVPGLGQQAADLIARLLTFARKAPQERKPLDLNVLLEETAKLLRRTLPETLTIRVEPSPEPVVVQADLAQVQQVFLNLATNARDAMPGGGTLSLRLTPVTLTQESVGGHPERRLGDFVCLTIADTGTGIPGAIRDRIFDPFFTTKAPGEGTGLGLASVHGSVHQHQGWLEVETAEGQGSAFHVFLPRLAGPAPVAAVAAGALPRGTETVLLVEDNPMVLELGGILLTELGYTILTARDGIEGLAVFRAHPEIALVLTDAIMPRMGASALIPALRALNPSVKVLVATGYAPDEIRASLDHLPLVGYVQKPFRQTELARAVRAALDGPAPGSR